MRPFEGIRIIDATHVLAGPFATYQLAVLGADVIKVENPQEPDQSRYLGSDSDLNAKLMGTGFLTQGSNKRSVTVNLKAEAGRDIFRKLVQHADVLVENYRPGAFDQLGLGYKALSALNPRLIYCSMSAFGSEGPRSTQTAYDNVIQANSGIMSSTGTETVNPLKVGSPVIDYSTGTMGAFALSSALFQRERCGKGQYIDLAMLDVAMILMSVQLTGFLHNGSEPKPHGNNLMFATNSTYQTKNGLLMLGASTVRQQERLWLALKRPDMVKATDDERQKDRARETAVLCEALLQRSADDWEAFFQSHHVPASRVRTLAEATADPQLASRALTHIHPSIAGAKNVQVPLAAFKFAHGGPSIETAPPALGQHTDEILRELGYPDSDIASFRAMKTI